MGWKLTEGLANLRAQVDAAFPHRDKTSDGTIGDARHQAGTSGHNPDDTEGSGAEWDGDPDSVPEVRAWDLDSDLGSAGVTAQDLVDHLRRLPGLDSVIRYLIYDRRMYHERTGFEPEPYTGASAHTEHIHFSGARSQAADDDTTFDYRLEDLVMPTAEEIAKAVWSYSVAPGGASYTARGAVYDAAIRTDAIKNRLLPDLLAGLKDTVDEKALAVALVGAIKPVLPTGVTVSDEQLQAAVLGALRVLAAPPA